MSAREKRHGTAYDEIVAAVHEARGAALIANLRSPDPHAGDLPIRHHETARIVAYVPERLAAGMMPVALNGLVVGYYKDSAAGRMHPMFSGGAMWRLAPTEPGEEWANRFTDMGEPDGAFLVRVRLS